MFSTRNSRNALQNAVCMLLAVVIVSAGLTLGALGAEHAAVRHYSVTITQL